MNVTIARLGKLRTVEADGRPRYSGSDRSGTCTCGSPWDEHHLCPVVDKNYTEATGEDFWPAECTRCKDCKEYKDKQVKAR